MDMDSILCICCTVVLTKYVSGQLVLLLLKIDDDIRRGWAVRLLFYTGPSLEHLALVEQSWFLVTLIVCIGSALWLATCVAIVWIIRYRRRRKLLTSNKYVDAGKPGKASSPVSIQTQSLALRALRKRKPQETQALALASSQSWLPLLRLSIPIVGACVFCVKNASACVFCGFRLRNARNASDCVWMETGFHTVHHVSVLIVNTNSNKKVPYYTYFLAQYPKPTFRDSSTGFPCNIKSFTIIKNYIENEKLLFTVTITIATMLWTRDWALDRVHNSRWPLDRRFALCDPVTLTFDLLI